MTDLMIDDWIYSALDEKCVKLDANELYTILQGYDDGVEGIQLAEELFVLNGFDGYDCGAFVFVEDDESYDSKRFRVDVGDVVDGHETYECVVCGCKVSISYVHELQHLLRLCGLKEVANNFELVYTDYSNK